LRNFRLNCIAALRVLERSFEDTEAAGQAAYLRTVGGNPEY